MSASLRTGLIAVLFHIGNALIAQVNVADELQRGDKQYDLYAYTIATQTYESVLKTDPNNAYAMARIGDCHMQLNRVDDAVSWYAKSVAQPGVEPDVYARYGKALMQKGDYTTAQTWFEKWKATDAANAQRYLEMCAYAMQTISMEPLYQVKSEAINSPSADFGPAFFGNRLVYSSSRTDIPRKQSGKSSQDWSGSAYNQLFITQINPETRALQTPAYFQSDLSNQFNEGPVSFSGDGKRVAFCRNNFIDGTRQLADKGINLSLYLAEMDGDAWKDPKAYPFNGTEYSTGYPSLSADGNTLYFASNRPGGQGGWDVYVSRYINGQWSMPANLGPPLNTPGNEISPFFDEKDLFFASDWHRGYGGLDVFKAVLEGDRTVDIKHTGPGINSSRDDYGFVYHTSGKIGFVTSNRAGGRGAEDLYAITRKDDALAVAASTAAVDITTPAAAADIYAVAAAPAGTYTAAAAPADIYAVAASPAATVANHLLITDISGAPLEGVSIDARQCIGETGVTDQEGKYYFPTDTVVLPCAMLLRKPGYAEMLLDVPAFGRTTMTATLLADQRKEMRGVVLDESTKKPLADAYISLTVPETGTEMQAQTNAKGEYVLFLTPGKTYNAQVVKSGYMPKQAAVTPKDTTSLKPVYLVSTAKQSAKTVSTSVPTTSTVVPAGATSAAGGYSIQVGAFPQKPTSAQYKEYEPLTPLGNVYNVQEGNMYKVRLGVYSSKNKANTVLKEVRAMPKFKSAYVVEERNVDNTLLLDEVNKPLPANGGQTAAAGPALHAVEVANQELTKPVFLERYANLSNLGNLYNKPENNRMSIRLGVWSDPAPAENARQEVVKRGYPNALLVTENGAEPTYQSMVITTAGSPQQAATTPTGITQNKQMPAQTAKAVPMTDPAKPFFVRLAALSKPESFKPAMLNGVGGTLEKKLLTNGMTLFYLSGFSTKAEAQTAVDKARTNGFTEAFVAELRDGQLVRHNN
ncbi:MAG: carboxypeptidase regulatory-like domain-containing protein [Saprospiraceae bacterium]|nr:carboxypeptidase regulatory-like domain-containing protein [Saprospiraceae bacterium]